jgi:hypothetical protein
VLLQSSKLRNYRGVPILETTQLLARTRLLALLSGLIVPVIILPRKAPTIPVLGGVLVLAVAATLGAVVALDLVDPTCTPPGVVNIQVNLRATRFVVTAVLFAVEVTKRSSQGTG